MNATHTVTGSTYPARRVIAQAGGEWTGTQWLLDDEGAARLQRSLASRTDLRNLSIKRLDGQPTPYFRTYQPLAGWDRTTSEYRG